MELLELAMMASKHKFLKAGFFSIFSISQHHRRRPEIPGTNSRKTGSHL
jgi:hypothetical protein